MRTFLFLSMTLLKTAACPPFFHPWKTAPRLAARFRNLRCVTLCRQKSHQNGALARPAFGGRGPGSSGDPSRRKPGWGEMRTMDGPQPACPVCVSKRPPPLMGGRGPDGPFKEPAAHSTAGHGSAGDLFFCHRRGELAFRLLIGAHPCARLGARALPILRVAL